MLAFEGQEPGKAAVARAEFDTDRVLGGVLLQELPAGVVFLFEEGRVARAHLGMARNASEHRVVAWM